MIVLYFQRDEKGQKKKGIKNVGYLQYIGGGGLAGYISFLKYCFQNQMIINMVSDEDD